MKDLDNSYSFDKIVSVNETLLRAQSDGGIALK